jgi:hypothetical protein
MEALEPLDDGAREWVLRTVMDRFRATASAPAERSTNRRKIVLDWAAPLGLTQEEALEVAKRHGLIKR